MMQGKGKILGILLTGLASTLAYSASQPASTLKPSNFLSTLPALLKQGHAVLQLGGYWSIQGRSQNIHIDDLLGDKFTVSHRKGSNGLVGLGYLIDGQEYAKFRLAYGLNAFYLPKTSVAGHVIQEHLYKNLSYRYDVTHYPVYALAKLLIKTNSPNHELTLDIGMGPNFMKTHGFKESSLDGITLPDAIFSSRNTASFSATVGAGIRLNEVFGKAPMECGYRFFYLGQGHFNKETSQVQKPLSTGAAYANAVMCSITV
jgi:hypothetical protein